MSGATESEGAGYPAGLPEMDTNTQASHCVLYVLNLQLCGVHI